MPSTPEQIARAPYYHEVGHAIAYIELGYDFTRIYVEPDGLGGMVEVEPRPMNPRDLLTVTYAGPAAEWIYVHGEPEPYFPDVDDCDEIDAEDLDGDTADVWRLRPLAYASGTPDQYERLSWDILKRRWADVENLANALYERREMTYQDVLCVL